MFCFVLLYDFVGWGLGGGRLPPAPRSVEPGIPLGLEAIIRQAIEPDARFRHPSAEALAQDLERFGSGKRGRGRS